MTFTASFSLNCTFNFYGDDCSKECKPAYSIEEGFYTCDGDGNKVCYENFAGDNCTECGADYTGPLCDQCKFTNQSINSSYKLCTCIVLQPRQL